jgi:hypothetical protein
LAPTKFVPVKFAPIKLALLRFALVKFALVKFVCAKFELESFALFKSIPDKSLPVRSAPSQSESSGGLQVTTNVVVPEEFVSSVVSTAFKRPIIIESTIQTIINLVLRVTAQNYITNTEYNH